jgi:hypothetical protein
VAVTAIGIGGYVLYKIFTGTPSQTLDNLQKQWQSVYDDYVKEYTEYTKSGGGALTKAQEDLLTRKQQIMNDLDHQMGNISGQTVAEIVAGVVGVAALAITLKYLGNISSAVGRAANWFKSNLSKVTDSYGLTSLARTSVNVAYAESGQISLAAAAQTQTNIWASTTLYPTMNNAITTLQMELATLTGMELAISEALISSLQIEVATTIPTIIMLTPLF